MHAELAGARDDLARRDRRAERDLLERRPVERERAGRPAPSRTPRARVHVSPSSRSPSGPSQQSVISPPSASSVWFVVMLDVAFSRRMCCSRVCSVRTKPRLPSRSVVSPTIRPGIRRMNSLRARRGSRSAGRRSSGSCRSTGPRRSPSRSRSCPGASSSPSDARSTCATGSAPRVVRRLPASSGAGSRQPNDVRLLEDRDRRVCRRLGERGRVGRASVGVRHLDDLHPEPGRVGLHDLAHLRVERLGEHDLRPSGVVRAR